MGLLSIIRKQKKKDQEVRVLVLGLDNAGKTTIVKKAQDEDTEGVSPTMGFQIDTLVYHEYTLNMWDIGGQTSLRGFWGNYFDQTDVVIWVVDGMSLERLRESHDELMSKVVIQDRLKGIRLAVVVNKMDGVDTSQWEEVRDTVVSVLGLEQIDHELWHVFLVSGRTGLGLPSLLEWVIEGNT
ncbi:uncharacterized protein KQ657_000041 [Scheffersomyces spartinae]|uniref:Uncharacterized protein n=1 Tax=Scheffersomyces spartinae TaxID=45513 RepID=A0A9P7VDB2_9ASCO|nr:uncharacterized protein KQ657_000041 [Scheffersomyces spartinae]KAG7196033.1 hypothetical protein KQ657_000041 [Scheffersomyces spartinae]